jgi:predicted unusual protein kinase regulating ubiquinone biosynthesis (AarF/ABC1/UbiB family)
MGADPHPGNIPISQDGRMCLTAWGMTGRLWEQDRHRLIGLLKAVLEKDAEAILGVARPALYHSPTVQLARRDSRSAGKYACQPIAIAEGRLTSCDRLFAYGREGWVERLVFYAP